MNYSAFPFPFSVDGEEHTAFFDLEFLMDGINPVVTDFRLVAVSDEDSNPIDEYPIAPGELYSMFDEYVENRHADEELREMARSWA